MEEKEIKKYVPRGIGLIGIRPTQLSATIRMAETDDGEETALHVKVTETGLSLTIVHYDTNVREIMSSCVWELDKKEHGEKVSVKKVNDGRWILVGMNNIQLHVDLANDSDKEFWIIDPAKGQIYSQVPRFSQVQSGGKTHHLLMAVSALVRKLQEDANSEETTGNYYSLIEGFYTAIGEYIPE